MLESLGNLSGNVLARLRELLSPYMAAELSRFRARIVDEQYGRSGFDPVPGYGCIFGGVRMDVRSLDPRRQHAAGTSTFYQPVKGRPKVVVQ